MGNSILNALEKDVATVMSYEPQATAVWQAIQRARTEAAWLSTDGAKVQKFVDTLYPFVKDVIPVTGQYAGVLAVFAAVEPFFGIAIDAGEQLIGTVVADVQPTLPDPGQPQPLPQD